MSTQNGCRPICFQLAIVQPLPLLQNGSAYLSRKSHTTKTTRVFGVGGRLPRITKQAFAQVIKVSKDQTDAGTTCFVIVSGHPALFESTSRIVDPQTKVKLVYDWQGNCLRNPNSRPVNIPYIIFGEHVKGQAPKKPPRSFRQVSETAA